MRLSILVPAVAVLAAGSLSAQTKYVSPAAFVKKPGNYMYHYFPFVTTSSTTYIRCRYQEVMDLPAGAKGKLSAIALRTGAYNKTYGAPPAFSATLQIKASTAATKAQTMATAWATNEGKDATIVLATKKVNFAKFPILPGSVQPFFFKIPFDKNKVLAFAGGKSLCLDMTQTANTLYQNSTYHYFYPDSVSYTYTSSLQTHSGRACYSSNPYFLPFYGYTYGYYYISQNVYRHYGYAYYGTANGVAFKVISAGKYPKGIPLAGGCSIYTDLAKVLWVTPSKLDSRGFGYFPPRVNNRTQYITVPWSSKLNGVQIYGQAFVIDPKANATGLAATQLNEVTLPSYSTTYPVSSIYRTNYSSQTTGYARKGYGHVTELTFN